MIATDLKGCVIYWNRGAENLYGWEAGEVLKCNILDVTPAPELRESEARHRQLARENAVLVEEVNHRVGNNLTVLLGLVEWAADEASTPETRQALRVLYGRIESMAEVHRMLNQANWP